MKGDIITSFVPKSWTSYNEDARVIKKTYNLYSRKLNHKVNDNGRY